MTRTLWARALGMGAATLMAFGSITTAGHPHPAGASVDAGGSAAAGALVAVTRTPDAVAPPAPPPDPGPVDMFTVVLPAPTADEPGYDAEDAFAERMAMLQPHWGTAPKALTERRVRPAAGAVTGVFGEVRSGHRHPGLDLDGETGDPIWAATAGTVVVAGPAPDGYSGYGTIVLLQHPGGVQTLYAHLSAVDVVPGNTVLPGTRVGAMGVTGWVTGSHLHFEVRRNGVIEDPAAWLAGRT